jgi:hypothetical protein
VLGGWQAPAAAPLNPAAPVGGAMPVTLDQLRIAVQALPPGSLRNGLLALVAASGTATGSAAVAGAGGAAAPIVNPLEIARQNIGQWYDDAMDRVTGAYKRWSQIVLFVIGLVVAVVMGVDAIEIAKALQADPALRAATLKAAQTWVDQQRTTTAKANGNAAAGSSGRGVAGPGANSAPASIPGGRPAGNPGTEGTSGNAKASPGPQTLDDLKGNLSAVRDKLAGLDIPFSPKGQSPDKTFWEWFWYHGLGFLLTALAASLGAPFWFDLLNRFVALRSSGKKPEPQKATS